MRLAASRVQTLHVLVASCMRNRRFFASTLREQLFELKNEDAITKSKNLRDTCACQGLSINTMHGPMARSNLVRQSFKEIFKLNQTKLKHYGYEVPVLRQSITKDKYS
jgi:hypothetical protein